MSQSTEMLTGEISDFLLSLRFQDIPVCLPGLEL